MLQAAGGAFFKHLGTVVLPYICGSVGVTLVWAYAVFGFKSVWLGAAAFLFLGALAFSYGAAMAVISTLKSIVVYIEDFAGEMFDRVYARAEKKVAAMSEGLTKQQAELLLKSSIKEAAASYKKNESKGMVKAVLILILSLVTWLISKILIGRVKEASGMEISLGLLFAGKFIIISAVFFNMRLLLSLIQVFCFVSAGIILLLPIAFL